MAETLETAYPMNYMEGLVYDENEDQIDFEDAPALDELQNPLDSPEKLIAFYERQINELGDFILENYDDKICGSAVETAIHLIKTQALKIRRLEKVQCDYARLLLDGTNAMHQPIEDEGTYGQNAENPPAKKMKEINLIDPKQGSRSGPSIPADPDPDGAFDRAREVV